MSLPGFRSLLAVIESGFEPVGIAVGNAAYQILRPTSCWPGTMQYGSQALLFPTYEQALREWWYLAVDRLEAEASARGAHGVVGVTVTQDWVPGSFLSQLTLIGSAVRVPGARPLQRPFLSMLSLDETLKLLLRGWVPTGIVAGWAAVHVHGWATTGWSQGAAFTNAELQAPTAGMQLARDRAGEEVRYNLNTERGGGAIAATVEFNRFPQTCGSNRGMLIEGRILATRVAPFREPVVGIAGARNLVGGMNR